MKFPNVKAEMARNGITTEVLAKHIGVHPTTLSNKLNGHYDIKLSECYMIKDFINENGGEFTLDELFPVKEVKS